MLLKGALPCTALVAATWAIICTPFAIEAIGTASQTSTEYAWKSTISSSHGGKDGSEGFHIQHSEDFEYEGALDGGQHRSCMDYFVLRSQATECSPMPPTSGTAASMNISLIKCSVPGDGIIVGIHIPPGHQPIFIATLLGPQVMALPITHCTTAYRNMSGSGGAIVHPTQYLLVPGDVIPGSYTLVLHGVFQDFAYSQRDSKLLCSEPMLCFSFTLAASPSCTHCNDQPASWPVCQEPPKHGVVLSTLGPAALPQEVGHARSAWQGHIRFQPQGCNFVPVEHIDIQSCFRQRSVCFVGDSHVRHLRNGFVELLNGTEQLQAVGNSTIKDVPVNDQAPFIWNTFGDLSKCPLSNCTDILFSFASWPLSQLATPLFWTAGQYAAALTRAFQDLRKLQAAKPGLKVYWLPPPYHHWHRICERQHEAGQQGIDGRYPPRFNLFVDIGVMLAKRHGIPVISTQDITQPLFDVTYDGAHHHHVGVVGAALQEYVANVLCVQDDWQARAVQQQHVPHATVRRVFIRRALAAKHSRS